MRRVSVVLVGLLWTLVAHAPARAEVAIGAVFGYPGNVGVSARFGATPIGVAWSEDFIHATIDRWMIRRDLGSEERDRLSLYVGPGLDIGIPLEEEEEFFLAGRVPIGLQLMVTKRIEGFGEFAPGLQFLDDFEFYYAFSGGVRFVLGGD